MTFHEEAAHDGLAKLMSTPDGALLAHDFYTAVEERWTDDYLDIFGQQAWGRGRLRWPMEQIACFGLLHVRIETGVAGRISIRAGGEPRPDAERKANAALLADLPEPFTAEVYLHQHGGDCDGELRWDKAVQVQAATGETEVLPNDRERSILRNVTIQPGRVPLEIGATFPSRTLCHLHFDRGVARWPYDTDLIWLLVNMKHLAAEDDEVESVVLPDKARAGLNLAQP